MYKGTKIPYAGFLERHFDPEFAPKGELNYGVLLRRQYLVIDCDPRNYKEGDKPLTRLLSDLELPTDFYQGTFMVRTPRGGFHIYLTKSPEVRIITSLKEYPGVEFKDLHITAAGTYIDTNDKGEPIKKAYTVYGGSPSQILKAPQILLAKIMRQERVFVLNTDVTPDQHVDIKRFIKFCETTEPAIEGQNGDLTAFKAACTGREYGLSREMVEKVMLKYFMPRCSNPDETQWLSAKVDSAFTSGNNPPGCKSVQNEFPDKVDVNEEVIKIKYQFDANGHLRKSLWNLKMFFNYPTIDPDKKQQLPIPPIGNYLGFDQHSYRIVWTKPAPWHKTSNEWDDDDAVQFRMILSEHTRLEFGTDSIHDAALCCAKEKSFHPIRDYIDGLQWDGQPRINNWLARYCGAESNEYHSYIGRKTLIAAIARVFRPGCKFDHVMIFEGRQRMGKSYLWEILSAPWFTSAPLQIHDKGAVEVMQGKWIVELAEMDALTKFESQTIKGFITRTEDRCRMAYARKAMSFPRQCVFVGTINPDQHGYLKDPTGNSRYWPCKVYDIDLEGIKRDRDQLWAEAYEAFKSGEKIYVDDPHMQVVMQGEVTDRMQEDPWFGIIERHLSTNGHDYVIDGKLVVLPIEIYTRVCGGNAATCTQHFFGRICTILKALGFERDKIQGKQGYSYTKKYEDDL